MQTVLVVEREPHLRQLLQIELLDANFHCICAEDSTEVGEILMFESVDLVVIGVGWPPQDDLHTMCWVKRFYPHIPVILFAAEEEVQPRSIVRVADFWVKKSSQIDLLVEALNRAEKGVKVSKKSQATEFDL